MKRRLKGPSPAFVVALIALFVALGGTTYAATSLPRNSVGTKQLKKNAVVSSKIKRGAVTARKIDTKGLSVPNAAQAANARELDGHGPGDFLAATGTAADAARLGGALPAAYQSRVTGTCGGGSGIAGIGSAGNVTCGTAKFYSGRLVQQLPMTGTPTVATIPGVAHVVALNCTASAANTEMINASNGSTDLWTGGGSNYLGTNWLSANTPFVTTSTQAFQLGKGSGAGASSITVTISTEATGSECVFQASAEVIGSS